MATKPIQQSRLSDPQVLLNIIDNLPTSIFVKDEQLRFAYSNHGHCGMIGKEEDELLGLSDADFYSEKEASGFLKNDRDVIENGTLRETEEVVTRADGSSSTVLTRKARLTTPGGQVYLIGTNTDLSEIKKREQQYRALTDTVPVAVAQIEETGIVSFINPMFLSYCGGDAGSDSAMKIFAMLKEQNAKFPGVACKFEADIQGLGQHQRRVIAISSGWLWIEKDRRSAMVSLIDVSEMTELRRINDEVSRLNRELADNMKKLAEAQDELVKKGRMEQLGQLTATIAHELRNPLGAVRTSAFLLERKLKDKGLGTEVQLERISNGVVRCDNIITQLLDFSRTKQVNCQTGDLDSWLSDVIEEEAKKLPAVLQVSCDLGLNGQLVPFDPARLQRAIINLVSNASEALVGQGNDPSKYANATPSIAVSTQREGEFVVIQMADNGHGMTPDVLARVRDPLFTTKSFGTGLGIPAIEQIAMQHGGRLDIKSAPGEGATFTIWLPMEQEQREVA